MFHSCGSSSRPVTRSDPADARHRVVVGVPLHVRRALTRMERNLRTSTMTPRSPTRCWRKWTGPGARQLHDRAMTAYSGDTTSSASRGDRGVEGALGRRGRDGAGATGAGAGAGSPTRRRRCGCSPRWPARRSGAGRGCRPRRPRTPGRRRPCPPRGSRRRPPPPGRCTPRTGPCAACPRRRRGAGAGRRCRPRRGSPTGRRPYSGCSSSVAASLALTWPAPMNSVRSANQPRVRRHAHERVEHAARRRPGRRPPPRRW